MMRDVLLAMLCLAVSAVAVTAVISSWRRRQLTLLSNEARRLRHRAEMLQVMRKTYLQQENRGHDNRLLFARKHFNAIVDRYNRDVSDFENRRRRLFRFNSPR